MNVEEFQTAYDMSRNGTDKFYRHPLVRKFAYSDGVRECAMAGLYWFLDILATELPAEFRKNEKVSNMCSITLSAHDGRGRIKGEFEDYVTAWSKDIDFTDLPDGTWQFLVIDELEGDCRYRCILLSEY